MYIRITKYKKRKKKMQIQNSIFDYLLFLDYIISYIIYVIS